MLSHCMDGELKLTCGRWLVQCHTFVKMTLRFKPCFLDLSPGFFQTPHMVPSFPKLSLRILLCRGGVVRKLPQPVCLSAFPVREKILLNRALELSVVIGIVYVCTVQYGRH